MTAFPLIAPTNEVRQIDGVIDWAVTYPEDYISTPNALTNPWTLREGVPALGRIENGTVDGDDGFGLIEVIGIAAGVKAARQLVGNWRRQGDFARQDSPHGQPGDRRHLVSGRNRSCGITRRVGFAHSDGTDGQESPRNRWRDHGRRRVELRSSRSRSHCGEPGNSVE